ncbi:myosin-binding protein 1-like isoform X1 [Juglans microcarpa x Juglans regia]|uniref:myosin-binding protein 1-like isoform X1 n=1 Tax=Juglans microcarpa x Juglans regia TaxID=2249226 RepID=UPI001B7F2F56|nr:myosin-binding protein 1-like isoform X1 [Juglans microcarpa x Juglans regia]XP_041017339.1 myosin-binding protein 1-like isoform X1 [Juglans microcarpa x Juglans regia]XP_041017340.1 myosin-binding protein 1-like isoform X1 [Juglans microcarpa x Juglans regia]
MATSMTSSAKPYTTHWSFTTALSSAVLEWLLIIFLFVNALFSFLLTKFSRYCKLQMPCLLCSRLDHVFRGEKSGYLWDLICGHHKLEISNLVLCHAHNKLVDVRGLCETCLFSFATINKSNAETYRLLVGKLGEDTLCGFDQDPLIEGHKICSSSIRHCSCCNEPWVLRSHPPKLIQTKSVGFEAAEFDAPLSVVVGLDQDDLKKRREKPSVPVRASNPRNSERDSLSHVGYTELKVNSDTESEVLYSDDDGDGDGSALLRETDASKDDHAIQSSHLEPLIITLADVLATENLIIADSAPEASSSTSLVQLNSIDVHGSTSGSTIVVIKNGLEEFNWQQPNSKASSPAPTEADSKANSNTPNDLISLDDVTPSSNTLETTIEVSKECLDLRRNNEVARTPVVEFGSFGEINDERTAPTTSSKFDLETKPISGDSAQQASDLLDLGDAYKIAVGNRGRQLSGVLVEQWVGKDSSRLSEDLKLLFSQLSGTRGIEQSMNEKSPKFSVNTGELKTADVSYSTGMKILQKCVSLEKNESGLSVDGSTFQKRIALERNVSGLSLDASAPQTTSLSLDGSTLQNRTSLERNESGFSLDGSTLQKRISLERNESGLSLDGSIVSELEGESLIDRLKRQIEHDRKHMSALYKELEEERNASAVAVNQAMAMITKLQEEKATVHMEALQCLRLMEEQSEYDMEGLQKANDLLAEKEKEMQDLEAELEFYRNKYPNESILENVAEETCDMKAIDIGIDHSESLSVENSASVLRNSATAKLDICDKVEEKQTQLGNSNTGAMKNELFELEDERSYVLQCLKNLEKKLYLLSSNGVFLENGEYPKNEGDGKSELKESNFEGETQENEAVEEDDLSIQHDGSVSSANLNTQASLEQAQLICKENVEFDSAAQGSYVLHRETDLASIEDEVSDLKGRLEALEADRSFLEHTINSVRNGEEGLQLIREVASHLRELRRIGIRRKDPTIA